MDRSIEERYIILLFSTIECLGNELSDSKHFTPISILIYFLFLWYNNSYLNTWDLSICLGINSGRLAGP